MFKDMPMGAPDSHESLALLPVRQMLGGAILQTGNHVNKVWRGMTGVPASTEPAMPMAIKYVDSRPVLAAELACSLAARVLRLAVPPGALVIAQPEDLPGLPARLAGLSHVVCYGSAFQWPDETTARPRSAAGLEEWTWQQVCHSNQGASGGAWDELVANPDRHYENVVFDGNTWWLIDHECALPSVAKVMKSFVELMSRQSILDDWAPRNTLAENMAQRRPHDHGLHKQPSLFEKHRRSLHLLCDAAKHWRTEIPDVDATLEMTEVYLRSIHLRLPALALHLGQRLRQPDSRSLWDPSNLT